MGGQVGRGGGRGRGPRGGKDDHVHELNGQGNNQGVGAIKGVKGVIGNVEGVNGKNVLVNSKWVGCSYKEFLAWNPKVYDGKRGVVILTRWIEKIESVQNMSSCSIDQKVKYTTGSFVGKALTWWNSQICTLSQELAVSTPWNNFKLMLIEEFYPSLEMQKLDTELWNHVMIDDGHAAYTDRLHELARRGSFNVIIGMDWLSNHKAKIIFHENVVRMPLLDGKDNSGNSKRMVSFDQARRVGEHMFIENFSKIAKSLTISTQKCKTFDWGDERELAFQTMKDRLCNVPILGLPDRPEDFMIYCDASRLGLGCVLMHKGKVIAYASSNYDYEIRYHPGKANVVVDALSRKERVKPRRFRAMNMTLQSSNKDRILAAQKEAMDESAGIYKGLDEMIEQRSDRTLYYLDRIWVPLKADVRTLIMDEAHKSKYSIHPCADMMYYDLRDTYWWSDMKKDIVVYVINARGIRDSVRHEYGLPPSDRRSDYHSSVRGAPFEALYGRKYRSPIMWAKIGEGQLIGPELVQETTEKISQIKDRLKAIQRCGMLWEERVIKKGKLAPRFVGPFEIVEKKCLDDPTLQVPLDEIQVDAKLNFVEEPLEILERKFKKLKRSRIPIVKILYRVDGGDFMRIVVIYGLL
nr:reverse transcriptase domain-containing protein [Tanacetum cinerariifolium]